MVGYVHTYVYIYGTERKNELCFGRFWGDETKNGPFSQQGTFESTLPPYGILGSRGRKGREEKNWCILQALSLTIRCTARYRNQQPVSSRTKQSLNRRPRRPNLSNLIRIRHIIQRIRRQQQKVRPFTRPDDPPVREIEEAGRQGRGAAQDVLVGQAGRDEEPEFLVDAFAVEDEAAEQLGGVGADQDRDTHPVHEGHAVVAVAVLPRLAEEAAEFDGVVHHDQSRDGDLVLVEHFLHVLLGQGLLDRGVGDEFPADGAGHLLGLVVGCVGDDGFAGCFGLVLDDLLVFLLRERVAVDEDLEVVYAFADPGLNKVCRVFFAVDQGFFWEAG